MLLHYLCKCKLIQPLWKMVWRFLKKLGIKTPYDPGIPLPGIYSEETKIEKDTCISLFTAALFTIARTQKQPRCPSTDEQIKKLWYIYTMEYYSGIKGTHLSQYFKLLTYVQLFLTINRRPPGSSVHGIFQARILEWVAISSSRGYSLPRDRTLVSCIAGRFFTV